MRNIIIDGRLGKDAELKSTKDGRQYVSLTVANDIYTNGENKTEWFNVTSFNDNDIKRAQYFTKGRFVFVTGAFSIEPRTNDGKLYLNMYIRANCIELPSVGQKQNNGQQSQPVSTMTQVPSAMPQSPSATPQMPPVMPQAPVYQQPQMPQQLQVPYGQSGPQAGQPLAPQYAKPQSAPVVPQYAKPQPVPAVPQYAQPQPTPTTPYAAPPVSGTATGADEDLPF